MEKNTVVRRKVVKEEITRDKLAKTTQATANQQDDLSTGCPKCKPPIKREEKYYDGKPRPICRGLLHGIIFFLIACVGLPVLLLGVWHGAFAPQYYKLALFLGGKGFSYGCSAVLHLFPFQSAWRLTSALKWDLAAVPISVWASSILLFDSDFDIISVLIIGAVIVALNGVLVHFQFQGHDTGLKTPEGRSDIPRVILVALQFFGTVFYSGLHYGYRDWWFVSTSFYILAFAASVPTTWSHEKEPTCKWIPWHKPGVYGFHEDFHWLLLTADMTFMYLGLCLLWEPSADLYHASLEAFSSSS